MMKKVAYTSGTIVQHDDEKRKWFGRVIVEKFEVKSVWQILLDGVEVH